MQAFEQSPDEIESALTATGYLPGPGLSSVIFLARAMHRPLLLEGEPGTGKTALAQAMATITEAELIRLQCYEGIEASQALYDWDFHRQILHLRAAEAAGDVSDPAALEHSLFDHRFLLARPILRALQSPDAVLLIDEIDRADEEFEAFLLEVLSDFTVTIPEFGEVRAARPPLVILTSNRTRDLHEALKRRCLYHWIEHPSLTREIEIIRARMPAVSEKLATQVAHAVHRMRDGGELIKPPGVAETLDWTHALSQLGHDQLDVTTAAQTLGAVIKYREDGMRIRRSLDAIISTS